MAGVNCDNEECYSCIICLIVIGIFSLVFISASTHVSMCNIINIPLYSETDFSSSEPYRVYLKTKVSTDCTLNFGEEDVYIEYKFRNKALAQEIYTTFSNSFNTTTPTTCITKHTNDFSVSLNEGLLNRMVC